MIKEINPQRTFIEHFFPVKEIRKSLEWRDKCKKFCLEFLPPGSPELNPIERVEIYTKNVHNRYFPTIDDVIAAVESQFNQWRHKSEALQRLCAIS